MAALPTKVQTKLYLPLTLPSVFPVLGKQGNGVDLKPLAKDQVRAITLKPELELKVSQRCLRVIGIEKHHYYGNSTGHSTLLL